MQDNSSAGTTLTRYARFARTTLESGTFIPTMRSVGKRALSTSHSYGLARSYVVVLTVTDDSGKKATATGTVAPR